jgi:hypothetical protein
MVPVTCRDGKSIFFDDPKCIELLVALPKGIVLPDGNKDQSIWCPCQLSDADKYKDKTIHECVKNTIEALSSVIEERESSKETADLREEDAVQVKKFFSALHTAILDKKRYHLRSLLFKLPELYTTGFSMATFAEQFKFEIDQVYSFDYL